MNEQLFDAMLRTALEEALEEDCREAPAEQKHTGHTSLRQRRRMRRMLADPWGYERRSRAAKQMEAQQKMQVKTPVRHLRWPVLAAAVLLLTVSVTGYALRGGAFFQSFFEKSPWAEDYAGTADTEQLTELGGTGIGTWTHPRGGYFISFTGLDGTAKETVAKAKKAGVALTGAGATWPYGNDPHDSNIRIAPSFPSIEELEQAARIFTVCARMTAIEKLMEK